MKTIVFLAIASFLIIGLALPGCGSSTLTILSIAEGTVFVMKAHTDDWIQAEVGMSLRPGDSIKTADNSSAEITFFEGSTVELQAGTEIEIAALDISEDTDSTTILLGQTIGSIVFRVTKIIDPASRYEVETPTGQVAVRGSVVRVHVIADGTTWATNLEGDIVAIAQGVELQVPEGQHCVISPGQPPRLAEIVLGATLPLTGGFYYFGQQGFGMQKAVDDQNDLGGIYLSEWDVTVPVRLIIKDNESDFDKVEPLSQDLVSTDEVHALLSPAAPAGLHTSTSVVANQYGVPQIIGGGPFEPWDIVVRAGEDWPYTWFSGFAIVTRSAPPRDIDGYTLADLSFLYMDRVDVRANTNMITGVFASDDGDGLGFYSSFPELMEDYGMTVIGAEEELGLFPMDTTDFTSIIQAWKTAGVEIIWGNCPGPHFGMLLSQCYEAGFRPKICFTQRAAIFAADVISWGREPPLGWGVAAEVWWSPSYSTAHGFVGIGNRTAASLAEDWTTEVGEPVNQFIGHGYTAAQVMLDAIERAGDVDGDAINAALAETDLDTISGWVKFDPETHFSPQPFSFGQWFYDEENEDEPFTLRTVASALDFIPEEADPIFPKPW